MNEHTKTRKVYYDRHAYKHTRVCVVCINPRLCQTHTDKRQEIKGAAMTSIPAATNGQLVCVRVYPRVARAFVFVRVGTKCMSVCVRVCTEHTYMRLCVLACLYVFVCMYAA